MRILLFNQNHIGDALFSTPAIAALARLMPEARIVNATSTTSAPLYAANPNIAEHWIRPTRGAGAFLRFARRVRQSRFDVAIIFPATSTRFGLYAMLSGAPARLGFDHPSVRRFLTRHAAIQPDQHHAEDRLDLIRLLGHVEGRHPMELRLVPAWITRWNAAWRDAAGGVSPRPFIGLNPGATMERKTWRPERWAALADMLARDGLQPVLFGGPSDAARAREILERCAHPLPCLQGRLDVGSLAAGIADCAAFVSADTGPLHMAVAQGRPAVALYGPTDPARTGPYPADRPNVVTIRHADGDPLTAPMDRILPEEVFAATRRVLEAAPQAYVQTSVSQTLV